MPPLNFGIGPQAASRAMKNGEEQAKTIKVRTMSGRVTDIMADQMEDQNEHRPGLKQNIATFFLFIFFLCPIIIVVCAFFFGAIIAGAEGWSLMDGFYYICSNLLGLSTPLTEVTPTNTLGKFVDIVISLWSLAISGTIIGIVGSMSVIQVMVASAEKFRFKFGSKGDLNDVKAAVMDHMEDGLDFYEFKKALDLNGPKWPEDLARKVFERLDADGSGRLSPSEVKNVQSLRALLEGS